MIAAMLMGVVLVLIFFCILLIIGLTDEITTSSILAMLVCGAFGGGLGWIFYWLMGFL